MRKESICVVALLAVILFAACFLGWRGEKENFGPVDGEYDLVPQGAPQGGAFDRLEDLSKSYLPIEASRTLPFTDDEKPLARFFSPTIPKVDLKGKLYQMNLSEAVRGTVGVKRNDDVPLVARSKYEHADAHNPGMFNHPGASMRK